MKKFYSFALIALVSLALASCGDKDDTNPVEKEVDEKPVLPQSKAEAEALVNAVASPLQTLSSSYTFLVESATETTVSFEGDDNAGGPLVSRFEINPDNSYVVKLFTKLYSSVSAANLAINRITLADDANVKPEDKNLLLARAKFYRGYNYFQLVQLYGEVPLFTDENPAAAEVTSRKSIAEVYAQAVGDLEAAAAVLPQFNAGSYGTYGAPYIPSALAAKAILSKIYLSWGSNPLTQAQITGASDPAQSFDNAKIAKAKEYASAVISSGNYELLSDFNKIWGVANENNREVIFSIRHFGDGNGDAQGNHQTHCGFTNPGGGKERVDPHIQYADITQENIIPDNDSRKLYSYVAYIDYEGVSDRDTLTWPLSIVRPGKWIHRTADGSETATTSQLNDIDHIDFRLAEIYLIRAEADIILEGGSSSAAAADINALRRRAGVEELKGKATWADLKAEYNYEFAFEQKHWFNLVRWKSLIRNVKEIVPTYEYYKDHYSEGHKEHFGTLSYNGISADPSRWSFYNRIYSHLHQKVEKIGIRHYRFPIPPESKTGSNVQPQNPGY